MSDSIGDVSVTIAAITDPLRAGLQKSIFELNRFQKMAEKAGTVDPVRSAIDSHKRLQAEIGRTDKAAGSVRNLGRVAHADPARGSLLAAGFAGGVGGAAAGYAVRAAGSAKDYALGAVEAAAENEKLTASFEVMTGSAAKAGAVIGDLRRYAADSPLGTNAVMDSAKQLAAYGIAADQLAPTLRMIGDVAAGDAGKLKSIALAYGQVATAGRLYGTELRQFSEAGVPLADELGKALGKPREMVKVLVEEGKVGFPDVVRAMKAMTSEGGLFYGMSARYADTFAGKVEQVRDGWENLQRAVGKGLVEEFGLKDLAGKAGAGFDAVAASADRVRPALQTYKSYWGLLAAQPAEVARTADAAAGAVGRLVGHLLPGADAGRLLRDSMDAVAHGVREAGVGARAWVTATEMAGKNLLPQLPVVDRLLSHIGEQVRDLQNLHVDPVKAADAFYDLATPAVVGVAGLIDRIEDGAAAIDKNFVQPFRDVRKEIEGVIARTQLALKVVAAVRDPVGAALKEVLGKDLTGPVGAVQDAINAELRKKIPGFQGIDLVGPNAKGGGDLMAAAKAAAVEAMRPRPQSRADAALGAMQRAKSETRAALLQPKYDAGFAAGDDVVGSLSRVTGNLGFGFDALGVAARKAAENVVKIPESVAHLVADAAKVTEQFQDPRAKLTEWADKLDAMAGANMIDGRTRALAFGSVVDSLAAGHGPAQLPSAAEYGSREAARLQSMALGGQGSQSVESLLKALVARADEQVRVAEQQRDELKALVRKKDPEPVKMGDE